MSTIKEHSITTVKIPDGRRNSKGDVVVSPTETWRPNIERKQSWCQEDLKRQILETQLEKTEEGKGFTEVEEGTKRA